MKDLNNNKANFIKTQDQETAEKLKSAGFSLIDYADNTWTFLNKQDYVVLFEDAKMTYSNKLHI